MDLIEERANAGNEMLYSEDRYNGLAIYNQHIFCQTITRNVGEPFEEFKRRIINSLKRSLKTFEEE